MIAIAESGSTKCEWIILNEAGFTVKRFKTIGFNPDFHTRDHVYNELRQNPQLKELAGKINSLYFYGAGCSSNKLRSIIHQGLTDVFTEAKIVVDHDLLSASYSLFDGQPIIACILGTGCNSAYFDGMQLRQAVPSLGFMLGDEGGGGYFGKLLLRDYFYGQLPPLLAVDFNAEYELEWEEARRSLYQEKHPNVYAASFMPFLSKHIEHDYVINLIRDGFEAFVKYHVLSFPNAADCDISFVGSVAFYFQNILKDVLNDNQLKFGRIIKSPADELVNYHLDYLLNADLNLEADSLKTIKDKEN